MAPCTTPLPYNVTTIDGAALELANNDRNALLYIVVTLLFYSMGIVVGIITYLKRERREMLEDKTFDVYFQMKSDPYTTFKYEKVQMVAAMLATMEKARIERDAVKPEAGCSGSKSLHTITSETEKTDPTDSESSPHSHNKSSTTLASSSSISRPTSIHVNLDISSDVGRDDNFILSNTHLLTHHDNDGLVSTSSEVRYDVAEKRTGIEMMSAPEGCDTESKLDTISKPAPERGHAQRRNVFLESPPGEPIVSVVSKLFDSERRGGLLISPKALHLFDRSNRRLKHRQLSMDIPDRNNRELSVDIPGRNNRQLSVDIPGRNNRQLSVDIPGRNNRQLSVDIPGRNNRELSVDIPGWNNRELSVDIPGRNNRQLSMDDRQFSIDVPDMELVTSVELDSLLSDDTRNSSESGDKRKDDYLVSNV